MTRLTKVLLALVVIILIATTYAAYAALVGHMPMAAVVAGISGAVVVKALFEEINWP